MSVEAPLISSSVAGPLGVLHLPRLWLKILLYACGRLPAGYRHGDGGFDATLFDNLGLDGAAFVAFVERERPDYPAVEAWVRAHATTLTPEAIAAHNAQVLNGAMPEERAVLRRAELGIDDPSFTNAVRLNDLDDWNATHARLAGRARAGRQEPQ